MIEWFNILKEIKLEDLRRKSIVYNYYPFPDFHELYIYIYLQKISEEENNDDGDN